MLVWFENSIERENKKVDPQIDRLPPCKFQIQNLSAPIPIKLASIVVLTDAKK